MPRARKRSFNIQSVGWCESLDWPMSITMQTCKFLLYLTEIKPGRDHDDTLAA